MEKNEGARRYELVVIGGSAGALGPLLDILRQLPATYPLPIIIVLHRLSNNEETLEHVLAHHSKLKVKEIEDKNIISGATVHVAPADYHLLIETNRTFALDVSEKVLFSRPSIDVTFDSVAQVYGKHTVAVLLSGANSDGTEGVKAIRKAGGLAIIQTPEDAEISYMPQVAIESAGADYVLPAKKIGEALITILNWP
jgi:two-component system chemotaxis response regulator CheB